MLHFMSMNRQLRRAQEKQDKKLEREKLERRAERRRRLDQLRAQRQKRRQETLAKAQSGRNRDSGGDAAAADNGKPAAKAPAAAPGRNDPGRFSGALAIATVVFIIMQAVLPTEPDAVFDSVIKAGFYLMLGYFLSLWLMRRGQPNALLLSALAGVILLTGTWLGFLLRPDDAVDGLAMLLSLPLLAVGIFLARFVFNLARSQNPG